MESGTRITHIQKPESTGDIVALLVLAIDSLKPVGSRHLQIWKNETDEDHPHLVCRSTLAGNKLVWHVEITSAVSQESEINKTLGACSVLFYEGGRSQMRLMCTMTYPLRSIWEASEDIAKYLETGQAPRMKATWPLTGQ